MLLLFVAHGVLAPGWEAAVHWQVKDGCDDNSTILHDAGLLFGDDDQCAVMAPSPELPQTTTGLLYAWGRCTNAGIEMGYGGTEAECAGSMNQTDGAYRITLVDQTHHGRCVCHPRPDAPSTYDTFTCTETTTTTTTTPTPEALASETNDEEAPKPHTSGGSSDAAFFVLLALLLCIAFVGVLYTVRI